MKNQVRQPKQGRSIEKKNKIIEAGYKLFSTVGYYGTNTAEIAKEAGVSTGIVYGYFADKRDILLCVLENYIIKVSEPVINKINSVSFPVDVDKLVNDILDIVIKIHIDNARLHNTLHSLATNDEGVNMQFALLEKELTENIVTRLTELNFNKENLAEKVHLAMNEVQSFAHELVFDNHDYLDYSVMRKLVVICITDLFKS